VDFEVIDRLLIRYSAFVRCWRKKWEYNGRIHQLFLYFEKAPDSLRIEVCSLIGIIVKRVNAD
jgi:hypothetical protein